ncbi:DUF5344 family protein [Heyndrickxia coagulans]|uniref:DUF5344 family protein n=1 Tax=Heyndrickxia coagulans TaxID=1398 RepID=UPI002E1F7A54|nr:DUF5344 family protein [Heyndrickxia coagulans]
MAKANRNSSPTYSLVRFAPSHSLRMGDFFRKAVKKSYSGRTLENTEKGAMSMEVKIHFDAVETSLANIRSKSQSLEISKLEEAGAQYHLSALNHIAEVDQRLEQILASYQSVTLKNEAAAKKPVQEIKAYDEQLGESFEGRPMSS